MGGVDDYGAVRPASVEDADRVADLMNEVNLREVGTPLTSAEEVRDDLTAPGRDPEDALVLVGAGGSIDGYLELSRGSEPITQIEHLVFVRPSLWGRGVNAALLRLGEERARAIVASTPTSAPVALRVARWTTNEQAARLFDALGYVYVRTFFEMRLDANAPTHDPVLPPGILVRTFDRDRDVRAVYEALTEAFADHWGNDAEPFERWEHDMIEGESSGFDAGLWFLAVDGDDVAGVLLARERVSQIPDAAYVAEVAVRRPWRSRGIARALLLTSFAELRRRGAGAIGLYVDAENTTGATRLYESVGMRTVRSFDKWQKELTVSTPGN